jgi:hypothetical protein
MKAKANDREIRVESDYLTIGHKKLAASVLEIPGSTEVILTPDRFEQTLTFGLQAIRAASFYRLRALRLGDDDQSHLTENYGPRLVFTEAAFDADDHPTNNHTVGIGDTSRPTHMAGVYESIEHIQEDFHPYWEIAEGKGYVPEVRSFSGGKSGGAWLLLALEDVDR